MKIASATFLAAILATASFAALADEVSLSDADVRCLSRIAASSPALNLAVVHVAGQCRIAATAPVASWLTGTPLVRELTRAIAQRIQAMQRGTVEPDMQATPRIDSEACAGMTEVAASGQSQLCTIAGERLVLSEAELEQLSTRCERALMSSTNVRVLPLAAPPTVVDVSGDGFSCLASAEVSTAGHRPQWRQLRISMDSRSNEPRSLDVWPPASTAHRAR